LAATDGKADEAVEGVETSQDRALQLFYALGKEEGRLAGGLGAVEFERTQELVLRHLPPKPAAVVDIGGGPGRYALWLASLGYDVVLRDIVALHIEQALTAAREAGVVDRRPGGGRPRARPAGRGRRCGPPARPDVPPARRS
jgi:hypothetical protein